MARQKTTFKDMMEMAVVETVTTVRDCSCKRCGKTIHKGTIANRCFSHKQPTRTNANGKIVGGVWTCLEDECDNPIGLAKTYSHENSRDSERCINHYVAMSFRNDAKIDDTFFYSVNGKRMWQSVELKNNYHSSVVRDALVKGATVKVTIEGATVKVTTFEEYQKLVTR